MQFTLICDWIGLAQHLIDDRFVIIVDAANYEEAEQKGAEAALLRYPDIAEYETSSTFWEGDRGATVLTALEGDQSLSILDAHLYDVFHA
ncbi:hypothetical protein [Streptomyces sp. NPDC059009]|uniref:hypothetical protein n=1 Tax=Streptomyces sp. NPDC059009 TaxID=3346694 RepID=UPI0036C95A2C